MNDDGSDDDDEEEEDDDDNDDHHIGGSVNTENGDKDKMKQIEFALFASVW